MRKNYSLKQKLLFVLAFAVAPLGSFLDACTRVVYKGYENNVITARSMDWKDEIDANL